MVTQPAYIANLKKYARRDGDRLGDAKSWTDELSNESDRGAILIIATSIEDMLAAAILKRLPNLKDDEQTTKRMFENDGQLATFSRRIELAYALGIIDKEYRKKLDLLREIRNACAHSRNQISLENDVLRVPCEVFIENLFNKMIKGILDKKQLRLLIIYNCYVIWFYITSGSKIIGNAEAIELLELTAKHRESFESKDAISPSPRKSRKRSTQDRRSPH